MDASKFKASQALLRDLRTRRPALLSWALREGIFFLVTMRGIYGK